MSEKQEMTIEEIRQKQMAITDYIDSVCEKAGLRYSLSYGTLLGAVRHKGFIPWDDDLDVMMVRKDYEAFISAVKAYNNPNFRILYQENTWFPWVKIIAADTYIIERDDYHIKDYGVWVDVFPYDEVPDPDTKEAERILAWLRGAIKAQEIFEGKEEGEHILQYREYLLGKNGNPPSALYHYYQNT